MASSSASSKLFRVYAGAMWEELKFSDVPINPGVDFHFILAFAADYTEEKPHTQTDGKFNVFWDNVNLSPASIKSIKDTKKNVSFALSLGGASLGNGNDADKVKVAFTASSVDTWVNNAVTSLTKIIGDYGLDGLDVDYEHFQDPKDIKKFTVCIGKLIETLTTNGTIKFASIAPYYDDEEPMIPMYKALWNNVDYGKYISYVNYQFYVYNGNTTVDDYVVYFDEQVANFPGGKVIASFLTGDTTGHFSADTGFKACQELKNQSKLDGIFLWCADDSEADEFKYEIMCQKLLAN